MDFTQLSEIHPAFAVFWAVLFGIGAVGETWSLIVHAKGGKDGTLTKLVRYVFGFSTKWKWARWVFGALWTWFGAHILGYA